MNENLPVPIICPQCGNKIEETFGRLEQNPHVTCPQCEAAINVKLDELREGFKRADEMLRKAGFRKK